MERLKPMLFEQRQEPVQVTKASRKFARQFMAPHFKRASDFDRDIARRCGVIMRSEPDRDKIVYSMQLEDEDAPQPDWSLRRLLRLPGLWASATDEYKRAA